MAAGAPPPALETGSRAVTRGRTAATAVLAVWAWRAKLFDEQAPGVERSYRERDGLIPCSWVVRPALVSSSDADSSVSRNERFIEDGLRRNRSMKRARWSKRLPAGPK